QAWRHALFRVGTSMLVALTALRIAELAFTPLQQALTGTVYESLVPGIVFVIGAVFVIVGGATAWQLPRWLARRQLEGRVAAAAVGESMWFLGLAAIGLPAAIVGLAGRWDAASLAAATDPLGLWGDAALRALIVIAAYGAVRLGLGIARSAAPLPLLVIVASQQPPPEVTRLLAALPRAWGSGPVCRVMTPAAAAREQGAHLRIAALAGLEARLFAAGADDVVAWHETLPPKLDWRALPVQELYCDPRHWSHVLRTWVTPQTCVVLVAESGDAGAQKIWADKRIAKLLPEGRTVVAWHGPAPAHGETASHSAAAPSGGLVPFRIGAGGGEVDTLCDALRQLTRTTEHRRIVLLHARADTGVAEALAARLDGRIDAHGRLIEAWAVPASGPADWRMPLSGFRFMLRVESDFYLTRERPRDEASWFDRTRRNLLADALLAMRSLLRVPSGPPEPLELVLLLSQALRDASQHWPHGVEGHPLVATAQRRIGVRLDNVEQLICPLDAQVAAPLAASASAAAGQRDTELAALATQIVDEAWVGLAPAAAPSPAADAKAVPAPAEAAKSTAAATSAAPAPSPAGPKLLFLQPSFVEGADTAGVVLREITTRVGSRATVGARRWDDPEVGTLLSRVWMDALVVLTTPWLEKEVRLDHVLDEAARHGLPVYRICVIAGELPQRVRALQCLSGYGPSGEMLALSPAAAPAPVIAERIDATVQALLQAAGPPRSEAANPDAQAEPSTDEVERIRLDTLQHGGRVTVTPELLVELPAAVRCLASLHDGRYVAGLEDGRIVMFDLSGTQSLQFQAHTGPVTAMGSLPRQRIVSGGEDGAVTLWDLSGTPEPQLLGRHRGPLRALACGFPPWVAAASADGSLCLWNHAADVPRGMHGAASMTTPATQVGIEGERVFVAHADGGVQVFEDELQRARDIVRPAGRSVSAMVVLPDSIYCAGATPAGAGFAQRMSSGGIANPGYGLRAPVNAMAGFIGRDLVLGCADGGLWLWQTERPVDALSMLQDLGKPIRCLLTSGDDG
ncbi:MAG TPA: hypothetical protein VGP22_16895, partial [Albitalea sp.]|nr:hypothetical protein [Albitalea sp.]